jgi:hypothetical protein
MAEQGYSPAPQARLGYMRAAEKGQSCPTTTSVLPQGLAHLLQLRVLPHRFLEVCCCGFVPHRDIQGATKPHLGLRTCSPATQVDGNISQGHFSPQSSPEPVNLRLKSPPLLLQFQGPGPWPSLAFTPLCSHMDPKQTP